MDNFDERVALLEGRVMEQSMRIDDVREAVASLEARMDQRFATIDQRFVGLDGRLDQMNKLLWGLLVMVATGAVATVTGIVTALFQK